MSAAHDEQTLAAAYVLGALEPDERRAFEAHVAGCASCAEEVRACSAWLMPWRSRSRSARHAPICVPGCWTRSSLAPPTRRPRVTQPRGRDVRLARARCRARVRGRRGRLRLAAAGCASARSRPPRRRGRARLVRGTRDRGRAAHGRRAQAAMSVLAAPDMVRIELAGQSAAAAARARALWSRNRGMVFTATTFLRLRQDASIRCGS